MAITEQDNLKQLDVLKSSYNMYEDTKKMTIKNMKSQLNPDGTKKFTSEQIDKELELINQAQEEVVAKYEMFGGNAEDLGKKKKKTPAERIYEEREEKRTKNISETEDIRDESYDISRQYNPQAAYDVIPLPSNGECYKHKLGKLPVAYLTAYDENMIISPNLYRDNKILDVMVREKVLNDSIDTGDLIEGDRDAIILFLRASGYGYEYPITATDAATGTEFDTTIDLTTLKFKDFKLKGDENGWFDFTLPSSGKEIKFKFLSHKDNVYLEEQEKSENIKLKKEKLKEIVDTLDTFIENDTETDKAMKIKVRQSIRAIESWEGDMDEDESLLYTHSVTNRLVRAIMSVDGVTDKKMIRDFVRNMNVKDSSALRKYMKENEPGIDYNITVQKPESLGGGSMTVFLQLDQYVFLNVAE